MIKAIETNYEGYRFRSRLEARWAFFFDELCWGWRYEVEGFVLEGGVCYLPDFYLPELDLWVEVKPEVFSDFDLKKVMLFSKVLPDGGSVMLVEGLPANRNYRCFSNGVEVSGATLSTYIKQKGWRAPYCGGTWEPSDISAMTKAKQKRFEFQD